MYLFLVRCLVWNYLFLVLYLFWYCTSFGTVPLLVLYLFWYCTSLWCCTSFLAIEKKMIDVGFSTLVSKLQVLYIMLYAPAVECVRGSILIVSFFVGISSM